MTMPEEGWSRVLGEARDRGLVKSLGAYVFSLILLAALVWVSNPERQVLARGLDLQIAVAGLVLAGLLAWFAPRSRSGAVSPALMPGGGADALAHAPPVSDTAQASIAVMPLDQLSRGEDDALIAQGFSAEITRALSGVPDLRVVPFVQSAPLAGKPVAAIAAALDVRYILSGTLQRGSGRIRIIVRLTDALSGSEAWVESYERDLDDLFKVQKEVAESIAIETGSRYMNIVAEDLCRQAPQGLSAWSLTHKALTFWTVSYTPEASAEAITWLEQALELEPNNAMAHVLLGFVLNQRVINSFSDDPIEENRRALAEVDTALRLAPRDATVMEYAALVWLNCGFRKRSLQTARRVVAIAPFNMVAWGYVGCDLVWGGTREEIEEGLAVLHRLLDVAPNHPSVPFWNYFLSVGYAEAALYEPARDHALTAVGFHPGFCIGWVALANAQGALGDAGGAAESITRAREANPRFELEGFRAYLAAITRELPQTLQRQTVGLIRAGLLEPLKEAAAAHG
jgi:TolB-like protein